MSMVLPADKQAAAMNAMYRHQRYIYDLTRKFYLLGRDELLDCLPITDQSRVLELGCGTGRNLIRLARRHPKAKFFGLDISTEMLATASQSVKHAGLTHAIALAQADSGSNPRNAFRDTLPDSSGFDLVFISYVLSMVPDWRAMADNALNCLMPKGILGVVDFADQSQAPAWRRHLLLTWLKLFHVHPRAEIASGLRHLPRTELLLQRDICSSYAYLVLLRNKGLDGATAQTRMPEAAARRF